MKKIIPLVLLLSGCQNDTYNLFFPSSSSGKSDEVQELKFICAKTMPPICFEVQENDDEPQ